MATADEEKVALKFIEYYAATYDTPGHVSDGYVIVDGDWAGSMARWLVYGYEPGSFLYSVLANDLLAAAYRTHPLNQWQSIVSLIKWMNELAPKECMGSYEALDQWKAMSTDQRIEACKSRKLIPAPSEILGMNDYVLEQVMRD